MECLVESDYTVWDDELNQRIVFMDNEGWYEAEIEEPNLLELYHCYKAQEFDA